AFPHRPLRWLSPRRLWTKTVETQENAVAVAAASVAAAGDVPRPIPSSTRLPQRDRFIHRWRLSLRKSIERDIPFSGVGGADGISRGPVRAAAALPVGCGCGGR
ncbi:unnamed protein product, partial [Ectocarpus sp. 12 AP-2014]